MNKQIIILAAGNGTRMELGIPKLICKIGDIPMIEMVISNALNVTKDVILVHSLELAKYLDFSKYQLKLAIEKQPLGTADAVFSVLHLIDNSKNILVIYADSPLISPKIMNDLFKYLDSTNSDIVTLSFIPPDPAEYGRIVSDESGKFSKIVEFKDATEAEKEITHCNSGIMAFAPGILSEFIPIIMQNKRDDKSIKKEFYLTSIIEVCAAHNKKLSYLKSEDPDLVLGVNNVAELKKVNEIYLRNKKL